MKIKQLGTRPEPRHYGENEYGEYIADLDNYCDGLESAMAENSTHVSALVDILNICENTEELSANYTYSDAKNCDNALTEIQTICNDVLP